jgi:gluconolactonase
MNAEHPTDTPERPAITVLAEHLGFPEGPVWMSDDSVLFVDLRAQTLRRAAPDGSVTDVAQCGGSPNGLAIGPDGAAYVCNNGGSRFEPGGWRSHGAVPDYSGGRIQRVDLTTGEVSVLYTDSDGRNLSSPNDLVFDHHGGFYFTDIGKTRANHREHGGLYYAKSDGSSIQTVVYPCHSPNGIGLSPDGATLYVAETETSRLWAFDVLGPGQVKKLPFPSPNGGRLLHGLPGFQRFDSLAVEADGNVCVGTLVTGLITVISPEGALVRQVAVPDMYPTNLCFGGPDQKTAYVTLCETGRLIAMPWPAAGLRLNYSA